MEERKEGEITMEEEKQEIMTRAKAQMVSQYNGHNVKASGSIDLNIKCEYGELTNYIQTVQMLNNDIAIVVKMVDEKPFKLGTFRLVSLNIGHDGEGKLRFNSMTDYVEINNLNKLVTDEKFLIRLVADIELEEGEE